MASAAAADGPPLRVGRLLTFLVDLRSAPATKQTQDLEEGLNSSTVQYTYMYMCNHTI